jgi:hypothetical protein
MTKLRSDFIAHLQLRGFSECICCRSDYYGVLFWGDYQYQLRTRCYQIFFVLTSLLTVHRI